MRSCESLRRLAAATALLAAGALCASVGKADEAGRATLVYDIPAQPMASALTEFARASNLKLAYAAGLATGKTARPVAGTLTREAALQTLLASSGLAYRIAAGTVTIFDLSRANVEPVQQAETTELEEINVQGQGLDVGAGGTGYVATRSRAGTKSSTNVAETPQSISILTDKEITDQGATDLAEVVRYTPGLTGEAFGVDSRGYGLQLRGFVVGDESFYRDGLPQRGTGASGFMNLDPYGAERYEILRGPSSVLYGQVTPGGIINYVSKRPTDYWRGEVGLEAGSFDHIGAKFDVSGPATDDKTLLYRFVGSFRDADTQVDFVEHDRYFFAPSVTYKPNEDTKITVLASAQKDDAGFTTQFFPPFGTVFDLDGRKVKSGRFLGEPDFDKYDVENQSVGYEFEHRFSEAVSFRQNARYSHLTLDAASVSAGALIAGTTTVNRSSITRDEDFHSVAVDNQLEAKFDTGALSHTMIFGLDHQRYNYDVKADRYLVGPIDIFDPVYGTGVTFSGNAIDADVKIIQTGAYVQDQIRVGKFIATLGGRHDWADTDYDSKLAVSPSFKLDDSAFSWRGGLVYASDIGLNPYYSYSESFFPTFAINQRFEGGPPKPETGQQHEVGVKYQPPGVNAFVTASLFDIARQNLTNTNPLDTLLNIQTGEIVSRGLELEGQASLDGGWDLKFAYTYLHDVEITSDTAVDADGNKTREGNRRYGTPKHRIGMWANYTVPYGPLKGLGGGLGVRAVSKSWGDNENSFRVPAAGFLDAAIRYDWGNYRFALNAQNLLNKRYTPCTAATQCYFAEERRVLGSVAYRW